MSGREIDTDDAATRAMMANPTFQKLTRTRAALGWTLAVIMLVIYYGFIALIAFDKGLLSEVVFGKQVTLGLVLGLFVLVSTFVLVAIYVAVANTTFDRLNRELRAEMNR